MRRTLLNDIIFKIVFGSAKNERILRALLNAVLDLSGDDKIVEFTLLSENLTPSYLVNRGAVLDVRAKDGHGRKYNVELQVREEKDYIQRSLYYLCKLYTGELESGEQYEKLTRTVAISVLNFPLFPDRPELHSRFRFCDTAQQVELSDILEIHYLELTKFRVDQPLVTPLEKWLHILKYAELYSRKLEELPEELQAEEEIVMALNEMNQAYATDEVRDLIELRLKAQRDEQWRLHNATQRGLELGHSEAQKTIAHNLAEQGVDPETIFRATGIRPET